MHRRTSSNRGAIAVVALTLTATIAGCTTNPFSEEEPLQTKSRAEVLQLVETRREDHHRHRRQPPRPVETSPPCPATVPAEQSPTTAHGTMAGIGSLKIASADQLATLARIRDTLRQQGYEITDDRTFPNGTSTAHYRPATQRRQSP